MKMNSSHISFEDGRCIQPVNKSRSVPVYWINLQKSIFRRNYYSYQLDNMGFENQRIKATTRIDSVLLNSLINVVPRVQHTPFELSCVISHLIAIHTAIYDSNPERSGNPYALITEDDVDFEMDVDLLTLAENAPSGFGSLQLITSNSVYVRELWLSYAKKLRIARSKIGFQPSFPHKFIWTARTHNSPYWSTQAYIINKKVVRPFIDKVVKYDNATAEYSITIVNPSEKDFPCASKKNCMLPYRIVSDLYIFSGCQPAYITNIPIFNGAIVGANSTIHTRKNNDAYHAKAFKEIAKILQDVRKNETLLPDYIRVKKNCIKKRKQNEVL